jgi:hypothetical protein
MARRYTTTCYASKVRRLAIASVVLAAAVAGCASRSSGPAWPRGHATDGDGGESLALRLPAEVAAIETHDGDAPAPPAAAPASTGVAPVAIAPTTVAPIAPATTDDPPTVEEITIEIDD